MGDISWVAVAVIGGLAVAWNWAERRRVQREERRRELNARLATAMTGLVIAKALERG